MKPGDIPFCAPDSPETEQQARDFCKTRGLNQDNARIVRRNGNVIVEIKAACKLKVSA